MGILKPAFLTTAAIAAAFILAQGVVLYMFGQPTICECGHVKLWENSVLSSGNSQHIADWYTFSHVVHGFIFYGLLAWLVPGLSLRTRLYVALGVEIGWEILENTPMVIQHYREQALAQGYTGDSILNSVMDTVAMAVGFVLAWRLPWWAIVAAAIFMEAFVLYMIRDGLVLNVVNLIHPITSIAEWQAAGGIK
jgi:hypothetical protein